MALQASTSEHDDEPGNADPAWIQPPAEDLRRLGEAVQARAGDVLRETVAQTSDSGEDVAAPVQESFERICTNSTIAVARWIAGEGLEVTLDSSRETSTIFGELAARRAASLHEVTRRSLWWRKVMADVLRECAAELDVAADALAHALNMLQLSLEFSLLRVCATPTSPCIAPSGTAATATRSTRAACRTRSRTGWSSRWICAKRSRGASSCSHTSRLSISATCDRPASRP
jgi:hypothetical protein